MKRVKQFILTILMVLGIPNINAQTMMNLEDVDYFLETFEVNHTILLNQNLVGSYDGDIGAWIALMNSSSLPQLDETIPEAGFNGYDSIYDYQAGSPLYGILVIVYDQNDDHCYRYDLGQVFAFYGTSLEYDGTGVMQYTGGPELEDEEEMEYNYIPDAYFQCAIFDLMMSSGSTIVKLIIYE